MGKINAVAVLVLFVLGLVEPMFGFDTSLRALFWAWPAGTAGGIAIATMFE